MANMFDGSVFQDELWGNLVALSMQMLSRLSVTVQNHLCLFLKLLKSAITGHLAKFRALIRVVKHFFTVSSELIHLGVDLVRGDLFLLNLAVLG